MSNSCCNNSNSNSCSIEPASPKREVNKNLSSYWDTVYETLDDTKLGWYEEHPKPSLDLIEKCNLSKENTIINIGAGATTLVDFLLEKGFSNLICTDISKKALDILKDRISDNKNSIKWIVDDLTQPTELNNLDPIDLWHDRAVLHFFTKEEDQQIYFNLLNIKVKKGGYAIIAAFNLQGASKCSGLPVHRYNERMLINKIGKNFKLLDSFNYTYTMPSGDTREYIYTLFQKIN